MITFSSSRSMSTPINSRPFFTFLASLNLRRQTSVAFVQWLAFKSPGKIEDCAIVELVSSRDRVFRFRIWDAVHRWLKTHL